MSDFLLSSYDYHLPPELIAQHPLKERSDSRLMVYKKTEDSLFHSQVRDILFSLPPRSTLVFNQSKVFPCRLKAKKKSGGEAEIFFLDLKPTEQGYSVLLRASGKRKIGDEFFIDQHHFILEDFGEEGTFFIQTALSPNEVQELLERHATIPLPPYIRNGEESEDDRVRYQTVYSTLKGSVAAPTAGLHFTPELLQLIKEAGHELAFVTLHVGLGTFKPVKVDHILDHKMHEETYMIDQKNADIILNRKGPLIGVGTTTLRVLESSFKNNTFHFEPNVWKKTSIFLHPGVKVLSIDALVTNFHLPKSTLLMLVASLLGREKTLKLYETAIEKKYRFFSYGDAMLLWLR
jgi:S-adenosylmethionine:tRNA ribosyltransferase-isomerase